jgi:hypothetical protein
VFLAKPAFKASFVAGYCFRPQGHRNGLIKKLAKKVFISHLYTKRFKTLAFMMQNNAFYCLKWLPAGSLPTTLQGCGIRVSADTTTRAVLRCFFSTTAGIDGLNRLNTIN